MFLLDASAIGIDAATEPAAGSITMIARRAVKGKTLVESTSPSKLIFSSLTRITFGTCTAKNEKNSLLENRSSSVVLHFYLFPEHFFAFSASIPYEIARWQDLKDLFRREVGDVSFVELFNDETGKPRGCGIVEFEKPESVAVALDKMNRYELSGRNLVVKEDFGNERDKFGRVIPKNGAGGGSNSGGGGGNSNYGRNRDRDDDR